MQLLFSTKIKEKETFFVEKIHKTFFLKEIYMKAGLDPQKHYPKDYNYFVKDKCSPKLHTIREDKKNCWEVGTLIDFCIKNNNTEVFRFAPSLPVVSIQKIEIKYTKCSYDDSPLVYILIDDQCLGTYNLNNKSNYGDINKLVQNDGFYTIDDFFNYFNEDYTGKIIHWTDLKY